MTCLHCGTPIPAGSRRDKMYCNNRCSALASYYRRKNGQPVPPRWQHPALTSDNPVLQAAAAHAKDLGQAHGWSESTTRCTLDGLALLLEERSADQPVLLSEIRTRTSRHTSAPRVAEVLADLGLFADDSVSSLNSWIDLRTGQLPAGFAADVREWLLVLLNGDARHHPRSPTSLYVYFGAIRPFLEGWAPTRGHLREITTTDIAAALHPLAGWQRRNAIAALRSLFRFAKKRKLIFANPTTRLKGPEVDRHLLPMTDTEISAVEQLAVTPVQRLVVALAAVHAARPAAIRTLTLDDLDLPNRRITLAGHTQRLGELPGRTLLTWLRQRRTTWPHTPNRHVLITKRTALGTHPVSAIYLQEAFIRRGIDLERIRSDRVLHEALTVGLDPLHLTLVFNLSHSTASRYAALAQKLLDTELDHAHPG